MRGVETDMSEMDNDYNRKLRWHQINLTMTRKRPAQAPTRQSVHVVADHTVGRALRKVRDQLLQLRLGGDLHRPPDAMTHDDEGRRDEGYDCRKSSTLCIGWKTGAELEKTVPCA